VASLRQRIRAGRLTIGSWLSLRDPAVAEIMARAGFDWLTVDLEHSSLSFGDAADLIRVIELCGVSPLVRLTSLDDNLIKRAMDAGAHGIIVPMVNSEADASRAVSAVHYPPKGRRGVGLARAHGYGPGFAAYRRWLGRDAIIVAQVEHHESVSALPSILGVSGVDATIVGPYDLSASVGRPGAFSHPKVAEQLRAYERVSRKLGKTMGYHVVQPDPTEVRARIRRGYRFIGYSTDYILLGASAREGVLNIRGNR
jgi:2-dehydro-3-deoxyglucarate aldolase